MKTVDARGFACPQPVIMAQKAIKANAPSELEVLVDNKCAVKTSRASARARATP